MTINISPMRDTDPSTVRRIRDRFVRLSRNQRLASALLSLLLLSGAVYALAELGGYGAAGPDAAPNALDRGLVGYWDMEEAGGQTVFDRSGNGNDGTLGYNTSVENSDPLFGPGHDASGPTGTGVVLDGIDDVVGVDTAAGFDASSGISLGGWIKPAVDSSAFATGGWNYYSRGYWTSMPYEFGHWGNGNPAFKVYNAAGSSFSVGYGQALSADTWYHIFASLDAGTGEMKAYINGKLVNSNSSFTGSLPGLTSLIIGGGSGGCDFPGTIDEFRLYNRALSADEVRLLYNQKKPVLEYRFDEGSGTVAHDESFNDNDGTISGAVWAPGRSGTALSFDGTDDYLNAADDPALSPSYITVSAWVKKTRTTSTTYDQLVVVKGDSTYSSSANTAYALTFGWGTDFIWRLRFSDDTYCGINVTGGVSNNTWHHVVGTYDGTTAAVYVDGVLNNSSNAYSGKVLKTVANSLRLGALGSYKYQGYVDNVRIYSYARSADEVLADYNDGLAAHLGANNQDLNYGLVGYWNMEEGGGQTVYDRSGQGNDGVLGSTAGADANDPAFGPGHDAAGPGGTGLLCDGTDDYANVGGADSLNVTDALTIDAWVKVDNLNRYHGIVGKGGSIWSNYAYGLRISNANWIQFVTSADGSAVDTLSGTTLTEAGKWHHIVAVFDRPTKQIYVDGVKKAEATWDSAIYQSTSPTGLGLYAFGSGLGYALDGSLDEVHIYNRALGADEVRQLYNQKKPVLEYRFDEGEGSVAHDGSFNGNDGTVSGAAWVPGKSGTALSFDGSNDSVSRALTDSLRLTDALSVSAWFNPSEVVLANRGLVTWNEGGGYDNGWTLAESAGGVVFSVRSSDGVNKSVAVPGGTLASGTFYHAMGVFDGNNLFLYLDGKLMAADSYGASKTIQQSGNSVVIGMESSRYFNGLIDNVRIYSYARSADEVLSDYNDGLGAHLGTNNQDLDYGLVGYWNMEEGGGQTVYDRSGQGNDGVLGSSVAPGSNDPTFGPGHDASGDTGMAAVFDGSDDYILVGNGASLKLGNAGTIAAWIYPTDATGYRVIYGSSGTADVDKSPFFRLDGGVLRAYLGNGTAYNNVNSGLTPPLNAWSFVVLSWDGSSIRMFLNSDAYSVAQTYAVAFTAEYYAIGKQTGWADRIFQGSLDEVRVYNRALGTDEVRLLYNQKRPVLEYKFEEGAGTVAHDESFHGHDGVIYGAAWADGKFGSALSFDGANDYVAIDNPVLGATEMTACVWAKKSVYRQYQGFIADYRSVDGSRNFILGYENPENTVRFYVGNGTATDNIGIGGFTQDVWHHVCGTFGGGQLAIYLDGQPSAKSTSIANIGSVQSTACNLGNYSNSYPFGGLLDEVRLYNYARSADEILADYNAGLAAHLR